MRHGSTGATPIRNSSTKPIGIVMRLKYGTPTDSRSPLTASTTRGNTVPSRTMKANAANTTLLARNAPSRDTGESMRPGERRRSPRQPISPTDTATTRAKNPSSNGPTVPSENAWTDSTTPDRVRNVPRIVSENVAHNSDRFQTRSIPRRSWTITEWM